MINLAKYIVLICGMTLVTLNIISQDIKFEISDEKAQIKHTTKWAAILPGSGQIINKKYWKAPIVVGGLLASGYFIVDNSKQMKVFLENWGYETDDDPNTVSTLTDNNGLLYLESDLEDGAYFYRRNRDLSYLTFFGVYLLQIVDANVDAHMKFFDASEDISFKIIPPVKNGFRRNDIWQIGLTMNIGK